MAPTKNSIQALLPEDLLLIDNPERIATLWSSYGYIYRLRVRSASTNASSSVILKSIHPPSEPHPSESHLRKLLSYRVERWFYRNNSSSLQERSPEARLARTFPINADDDGSLLLEDLSLEFPYPARGGLGLEPTRCVLRWLANFHSCFWNAHLRREPSLPLIPPPLQADETVHRSGVWAQGTYWYLDTRKEEVEQIDEEEHDWLLPWVDKVNNAVKSRARSHGTLLHGDVKGANILFTHSPWSRPEELSDLRCALYDLQYVGVGLPTHDLVYFIGTTVSSSLLKSREHEQALLDYYYGILSQRLASGPSGDRSAIYERERFIKDWELSLVDWYRFMAGWGFWGNDSWVEARVREIIKDWSAGGWDSVAV
ncbi:hypothetical protein PUNSTDRAFT_136725 [Punctularia strigosozonata HHB-11173 SS5]|uniref:uncharacterized protein n=1 Tax=Punctularia strigosozonata (strain HHB-11173) TaxID=741275 RepID=UPI0004416273|nr:uncharacterized protein PUNSTDRAFT_136725 [Punctularia strigosozonata HHB-11173 SS5]EIN06907.1 hypothetical protein PUNSTDRAFT_136725 [Punctularia strigosozonata HHB-11173 SS5]